MNTQISKPVKIFAAVMGVLILGVGGMTMMKGGSSSSSANEPLPAVTHPAVTTPAPAAPAAKAPTAHPAKPPVTHTAKPAATKPATPTTHVAPVAHAKPHVAAMPKPKPVPAVAANGLPGTLDELLHIHQIVVVAVWDSEIPTDKLFVQEAAAGAKDANAGFLAVNVLDNKVAGPLTAVAGHGSLLPSPGLLIYKEPSTLMNVITGFIDRAAVAEAVVNARTADAPNGSTAAATTTPSTATPVTPTTPVTTTP